MTDSPVSVRHGDDGSLRWQVRGTIAVVLRAIYPGRLLQALSEFVTTTAQEIDIMLEEGQMPLFDHPLDAFLDERAQRLQPDLDYLGQCPHLFSCEAVSVAERGQRVRAPLQTTPREAAGNFRPHPE